MTITTSALTLTHYTVSFDGRVWPFASREASIAFLARHGAHVDEPEIRSRVIEHTTTYRVGDQVSVRAFGTLRPGVVVKLGRSKVTVQFTRNYSGERATRSFDALDVISAPF